MSLHVLPAGVVSAAYSSDTGSGIGAATFDGADELTRAAPGVFPSDGKEWAFSLWFNLSGEDDAVQVFFSCEVSGSNRFLLQRSPSGGAQDNNLAIVGRNTSNTLILYIESLVDSGSFDSSSRNTGWNHFLCSGNLATSTAHMYANGVNVFDSSADYFVNSNMDFTGDFHVGHTNSGAHFHGEIAEFWLDDSFIDFSSSTNREKFRSSGGEAVDLGSDGSTPTGSSPLVYLHLNTGETGDNFASNAGTGGDLSVTAGALVNAGGLD